MKFQKGKSGNPQGRRKGSKNKVTTDIKQALKTAIENQLETLEADLKEMEPEGRVKFVLAASEFVIPKLARSQVGLEIPDSETFLSFLKQSSCTD